MTDGCCHGWIRLRTQEGANDGLENFALAGPGLGSPDDNGNRESLLENIAGVVPVRAEGLALLVGRTVCAVVYGNDIALSIGSANLTGPNLGRVAFKVVAVLPVDGAAFSNVQVEILEDHEVCDQGVVAFAEAPDVS